MSVRKRNKGYQIDISHAGKRYRFNINGDMHDALITEQQCKKELDQGRSIDKFMKVPDHTVGYIFDKIKDDYKSTRELNKACNVIRDIGSDLNISDLDQDRIEDMTRLWRSSMNNSNATINRKLSVISKIISFAHKKQYIKYKPQITWHKEGVGRLRYLVGDEEYNLCKILRSCGHNQMADMIIVACDTGLRFSELIRIDRDLDLKDGYGCYRTDCSYLTCHSSKNDTTRTIPLTHRSYMILKLHGKKPFASMTETRKNREWNLAKEMMGLSDDRQFTFHCTRHTCASRLVQNGIPLQVVQKWLGHKTLNMTLRYSHLDTRNFIEGKEVLERQGDNTYKSGLVSIQ